MPHPFPTLKPTPGWVLVRVTERDTHAHQVPDTAVTLHLPTGFGECADPGAGIGELLTTHPDGPTGYVGFTVFLDPYAIDEGRNVENSGCYLIKECDLFAVLLADGTVSPLGKWILGEAVARPEVRTASGLLLPAVRAEGFHEERGQIDWNAMLVGVMRVLAVGPSALPEYVGHEQRRTWGKGPLAYFGAFQNGADDARRRRMNGKEYLLLQYPDVLGLSAEVVGEVKRRTFMGME